MQKAAQDLRQQAAQQDEASGQGGGASGGGGGSSDRHVAGGGGGGGGGSDYCDGRTNKPNFAESLIQGAAHGAAQLWEWSKGPRQMLGFPSTVQDLLGVAHGLEQANNFKDLGVLDQLQAFAKNMDGHTPIVDAVQGIFNDSGLSKINASNMFDGLGKGLTALNLGQHTADFIGAKTDAERVSAGLGAAGDVLKTMKGAPYLAGVATSAVSDMVLHASQSDFSCDGIKQVFDYVQENPWAGAEEFGKAIIKSWSYF